MCAMDLDVMSRRIESSVIDLLTLFVEISGITLTKRLSRLKNMSITSDQKPTQY